MIKNEENIKKFTSEDFFTHLQKYYSPKNMVCVISGNFNEEEFINAINKHTDGWENNINPIIIPNPKFHSSTDIIVKKEIEQTNIVYGLQGYSYKDNKYYQASIANAILGGGMSSRLFVEIREKRGLAYSVSSSLNSYETCGTFSVNVGCNKNNAKLVLNLIKEEIAIAKKELQEKEIEKAKNQLKSSILMSLESTQRRAERLAANILNFNEVKNINNTINNSKIHNLN